MKNGFLVSIIIFILLSPINCFSQDSISKSEWSFPKNHIKYNFLPLIAHTFTLSYEREIAKRISFELEFAYIFPLFANAFHYGGIISSNPLPFFPSQGYLGRGSLRYFLSKKEKQKVVLFTGISFLYKYRFYKSKFFKESGSYAIDILQSEKNTAYAGEIQFGIRFYSIKYKHISIEISTSFGYGKEYRITDKIKLFDGINNGEIPIKYWDPNNEHLSSTTLSYYSYNPCFKIGYAF